MMKSWLELTRIILQQQNNIPIFCPALTDGSLGDMIYFHSFRNPGLIVDIAADIRKINELAVWSRRTGMVVLGGGVVKHHVCNANLMVRFRVIERCPVMSD
jgi:deoxyhypusine synthase